jgi:hypothetical protein
MTIKKIHNKKSNSNHREGEDRAGIMTCHGTLGRGICGVKGFKYLELFRRSLNI